MVNENKKAKVKITPAEEWPTQGTIEFKDVQMSYDKNLAPVLDKITFSINDGEKIGKVDFFDNPTNYKDNISFFIQLNVS